MNRRLAKKVHQEISVLGFGGWQLGNNTFWGEMSENEAVDLVKEAIKNGVNFFDTAPGYSGGRSEYIIGQGIKGHRDNVFINTKYGHKADGSSDFSSKNMESTIQESLDRLEVDYLDSVILHNPEMYILEGKTDLEDKFQELKLNGLIRGYGVSIDSYEELKTVLEHWDVDVIEILFNIVNQDVAKLFNEVERRGILLVVKVPLDSGWLTGKYDQHSQFSGIRSRWNQQTKDIRSEIIEKIKNVVTDNDLVKSALSFILKHNAVTTVIPGVKNKEQLYSNIDAVEYSLPNEVFKNLQVLYEQYISKQNRPW